MIFLVCGAGAERRGDGEVARGLGIFACNSFEITAVGKEKHQPIGGMTLEAGVWFVFSDIQELRRLSVYRN